MPVMGVCDKCGMLLQLLPDGTCPNGHGRSAIRDTFETRAPSIRAATFADEGGEQAQPPADVSSAQPAGLPAATGRPEFASQSPADDGIAYASETPATARTPVTSQESAQKVRRAIIIAAIVFLAFQLLSSCAAMISNGLRNM